MVLVQKWPFFQLLFLGNVRQENVFHDILEQKNAFLGYKKRSLKSQKIDISPKRLTHGCGPRMAIFPRFFVRQYREGKWLLRYFKTKKRVSRL